MLMLSYILRACLVSLYCCYFRARWNIKALRNPLRRMAGGGGWISNATDRTGRRLGLRERRWPGARVNQRDKCMWDCHQPPPPPSNRDLVGILLTQRVQRCVYCKQRDKLQVGLLITSLADPVLKLRLPLLLCRRVEFVFCVRMNWRGVYGL